MGGLVILTRRFLGFLNNNTESPYPLQFQVPGGASPGISSTCNGQAVWHRDPSAKVLECRSAQNRQEGPHLMDIQVPQASSI